MFLYISVYFKKGTSYNKTFLGKEDGFNRIELWTKVCLVLRTFWQSFIYVRYEITIMF
jgi:hypothetical protein